MLRDYFKNLNAYYIYKMLTIYHKDNSNIDL